MGSGQLRHLSEALSHTSTCEHKTEFARCGQSGWSPHAIFDANYGMYQEDESSCLNLDLGVQSVDAAHSSVVVTLYFSDRG